MENRYTNITNGSEIDNFLDSEKHTSIIIWLLYNTVKAS